MAAADVTLWQRISTYSCSFELQGRGHVPDLGPERTGPRDTIWRLVERPWPRLGRETVDPALLVAWLSTEAAEPMETMDTDLLWLWPFLDCESVDGRGVGDHGTEPVRLRVVFVAGTLRDEVERWPRRGLWVADRAEAVTGGARRLEVLELAGRS